MTHASTNRSIYESAFKDPLPIYFLSEADVRMFTYVGQTVNIIVAYMYNYKGSDDDSSTNGICKSYTTEIQLSPNCN